MNPNPDAGNSDRLKEKAAALPRSPGVYLMKDASGRIIYVGKAKSLNKRVASYFQKQQASPRISRMVARVADVDFMVTDTEKEALILENSLIKKHKPQYNVVLRDDKTYPSLRLTVGESCPRLEVVRRVVRDGSVYFGPFSSASAMRRTLRLVRALFPLRQCRRPDVKAVARPCLNYQLGRCLGPCHGHATEAEYRAVVNEVILFFQGKNRQLTAALKAGMKAASERLDFEAAARYRDRLFDVERTLEKQKVVSAAGMDQDVLGLARDRGQVLVEIMHVRGGALLGGQSFLFKGSDDEPAEVLESMLTQYYAQDRLIPAEILLPTDMENRDLVRDWLKERRGKSVRILTPARGPKKHLVDLARQNAETALAERLRAVDLGRSALEELGSRLGLLGPPVRIEGYDMSTLRGESPVGVMVVLDDGRWARSDYRRFRIKDASGQDDYAMMSEVLGRRLAHQEFTRPDLILLDGGRGQLGVARAVIADLGLKDPPPLAGLAKGREGGPDRVWLPGRKNPVDFPGDSPGLLLLMRVRDEAHRYAQAYHHRLRAGTAVRSALDDVPGVGPQRRKALLAHFGSVEAVKSAGLEELAEAKGMTRKAASNVHDFFQGEDQ